MALAFILSGGLFLEELFGKCSRKASSCSGENKWPGYVQESMKHREALRGASWAPDMWHAALLCGRRVMVSDGGAVRASWHNTMAVRECRVSHRLGVKQGWDHRGWGHTGVGSRRDGE